MVLSDSDCQQTNQNLQKADCLHRSVAVYPCLKSYDVVTYLLETKGKGEVTKFIKFEWKDLDHIARIFLFDYQGSKDIVNILIIPYQGHSN